jgi:hypothetical protein
MVPSGDGSMHQRLFHYAMIVYAFGFIVALTLNIDVSEQIARAPAKVADPAASIVSNAANDCASQPNVRAIASAGASPSLEPVGVKAPCVAHVQNVVPLPDTAAPKPVVIPVVEPVARQDL